MDDDTKEKYVEAGRIASKVRESVRPMLVENALYLDIAEYVESEIIRLGGGLAFPVNISVDSIAAHYSPHSSDTSRFKAGNVVKVDLGVHVDGFIADTAFTKEISTNSWQDLIDASDQALERVLDSVGPGTRVTDIGNMVSQIIGTKGYLPISNLSGHRLECYNLHAGLSIPNIPDGSDETLEKGMAVAIEPFATNGAGRVTGKKSGNIYRMIRDRQLQDKDLNELLDIIKQEFPDLPFSERWVAKREKKAEKKLRKLIRYGAVVTYPVLKDAKGGFVSQAEHTVLITKNGCLVTTR